VPAVIVHNTQTALYMHRPDQVLRSSIIHALLLVAAISGTQRSLGQAFSITEPSITTCTGALLDSGGEGASGYSDNEDYVCTICSDQPGQAITLNWTIFNLSTAGTAPLDQVTIYDGPDMSAPVIGTYSAGNSPGIVSASFGNTSGCLTLHWTSNDAGQGLFSASITCYVPCEPPTAVVSMSEAAPALICQGEAVTFNAGSSFAAAGNSIIQYEWHFDDGSVDSTTGPVISHAFAEPGEYVVEIVLTDDNACNNTNLIDLPVRVSTTPVFNLSDTSVCLGNEVPLVGMVSPTTWTDLPNADFGEAIPLPDNLGVTFSTELTYTVFDPGATLSDTSQLLSICVDMEHTFIGDLVIQIVCPNGSAVTLHEQGGGGTFVGDANDADDVDPDPGTCWHYCWSPDAPNGTWADCSDGGSTPHTMPSSQGSSLIPDTYTSVQPLSGLLGCPLNGTWTFNITDNWSIDNGFICSWGMTFDPALYPDLTTYTPVLGLSTADSAFWTGNGVVLNGNDPTLASVTPTTPGSNTYTFSVTDNFGCTYSDSLVVTASGPLAQYAVVPSSPQPIGAIAQFTDTSIPNGTTISSWSWDFGNGLPGSAEQNPAMVFTEPGTYLVTLTITSIDGCQSSVTYEYTIVPSDVIIPNVFSPDGDEYNEALEFANAQYFDNNHLRVYNRWGQMIYESLNYRNTWRPRDVPEGTYYFVFAMADGRKWAGHVTLLRKN
jgi:gliding motility-associated-like protein